MLPIYIGGLGIGISYPGSGDLTAPWPIFGADSGSSRPIVRTRSLANGAMYAAAWTVVLQSLLRHVLRGAGTADLVAIPLNDILQDGATIAELDIYFAITTGHSGLLPANQPAFFLTRYKYDGSNLGLGSLQMAAANAAVYENGGAIQNLNLPGFSTVVDKTQYFYCLLISDENSTNAIAGNKYFDVRVTQTATQDRPF